MGVIIIADHDEATYTPSAEQRFRTADNVRLRAAVRGILQGNDQIFPHLLSLLNSPFGCAFHSDPAGLLPPPAPTGSPPPA